MAYGGDRYELSIVFHASVVGGRYGGAIAGQTCGKTSTLTRGAEGRDKSALRSCLGGATRRWAYAERATLIPSALRKSPLSMISRRREDVLRPPLHHPPTGIDGVGVAPPHDCEKVVIGGIADDADEDGLITAGALTLTRQ